MPFQLAGHARAIANTSIGAITLDPIAFDVPSGLDGLRGLRELVTIGSVDVLGGSAGAIHLGIDGASGVCDVRIVGADVGDSGDCEPVEFAAGYGGLE